MNRIIIALLLTASLTGCGAVETIQTIHQRGRLDVQTMRFGSQG
jgi:uncharacterized protein YceK